MSPGNAITQSFMSIPALLLDFPRPSSPEHTAAARHLGRQWPVFWQVGNVFFRPLSMLGFIGYTIAAVTSPSGRWVAYTIAAAAHLVTIGHSAVHMQPINEKLHALGKDRKDDDEAAVDMAAAEPMTRRWARLNLLRVVLPLTAGTVALCETMRH